MDITTPDSEGDGPDVQTDRDPQSDEIIKQLEKGLASWPGFGEDGWMGEVKPVSKNLASVGIGIYQFKYQLFAGAFFGYRAYD